jgi:predicted nucleotidyltransferase
VSREDPGLSANVALLSQMVALLGDLADALVFVGGCATGLLVTEVRAGTVRMTTDVDVVAAIATIREYHAMERQLEQRGFTRDRSPDAPICRWLAGGLRLDLLPSERGVLEFHNQWYPIAVATALPYQLSKGRSIRLVTAPLFIATKLEAFADRGRGDYVASHDLEDIVTVVDGREELVDEARRAPESVREYLKARFSVLLAEQAFVTALPGHLPGDAASQARVGVVLERLRALAKLI